jgi:hypothetical protein
VAKRDQQLPKAEDYALLHLGLLDGRDAGLDAGLKSFEATWRHTKANMERVADALDADDLSKVIETDLPPHRWGVAAGSIAELFSDDPKVAADELRKAVKRIERSGGAEGDLSSRRLCRRRRFERLFSVWDKIQKIKRKYKIAGFLLGPVADRGAMRRRLRKNNNSRRTS